MMMLGCMIGVMAMDTVVRRSDEGWDAAVTWLTTGNRNLNDGICKDGGMAGLPVLIRSTTSAEPIRGNPANPANRTIPEDKHSFHIPHAMDAKKIHKMMARYKKKVGKLLKAIEHVASKTSIKGGSWLAKASGVAAGSHFESHGIQEVIGRMRGFEKCRGIYEHLEAVIVKRNVKAEALAAATEFRNLVTEGDDCCDEECYATENGGKKWNADKEVGQAGDLLTEGDDCVPCKSGAPLKPNGEPEYFPEYTHPSNEELREGVKPTLTGEMSDEIMGRVSIDDPINYKQYEGSKECYRKCPDAPDGQCRGLKSLARRAAKELSITLSYDVCQTLAHEVKRNSANRLCGPFTPGVCLLSLEHILMRGNAKEVWEGEYGEAKAFGATCTKGSGEKELYERFGETGDSGAIPVLEWADNHIHVSPNDNGDEKDKDIKY